MHNIKTVEFFKNKERKFLENMKIIFFLNVVGGSGDAAGCNNENSVRVLIKVTQLIANKAKQHTAAAELLGFLKI